MSEFFMPPESMREMAENVEPTFESNMAWFYKGPLDKESKLIQGKPRYYNVMVPRDLPPLPVDPGIPAPRAAVYQLVGRNHLGMLVYRYVGEEG